MYRIRRKADGLYSSGNRIPRFTSVGRRFPDLQHVIRHLNEAYRAFHVYFGCELVRFEEVEIESHSIDGLLGAIRHGLRATSPEEDEERDLLRKLKTKYPDE